MDKGDNWKDITPPISQVHTPAPKKTAFLIAAGTLLGVSFLIWKSKSHSLAHNSTPPVLVVAAPANLKNIPVYVNALGAIIPTITVTVKTQINGQLLKTYFNEGQIVKQGELLALIDPRPYQAQLIQYEGQLLRDKALLANAQGDLARYSTLWKEDSVSKQTLDTQNWLVKQYLGAVKNDEGLIQAAKLNIQYCSIRSPVTARIGLKLVDPGNYVQTTDATGLFVLNTIDPITAIFSIPEDYLPSVKKEFQINHLSVEAYDRLQNKLLNTGMLTSIDNQIDPTTGTIKLKANFTNAHDNLYANQFVNIKLKVEELKDAITIPKMAVQHGVKGTFVYVLNDNHTVKLTPVTTGVSFEDDIVILNGILSTQKVIIQGTDKLTDGAKIKLSAQKKENKREHS